MSNIILDPVNLSQDVIIKEDTSLKYFMTNEKMEEKSLLHFVVEENTSLEIVMVDLTCSDIDCTLTIDLKRGSKAILSLACINTQEFKKIYHFDVNHNESDTFSRVTMSGINAGASVLKFLGNSLIINGAHRSDTRQEGRITNLHPDAKSEASPSLLIKENDVNASHGAALGAYNIDQLYYLMSRGISMAEAKKLITFGSLLPVIERLEDEELIDKTKHVLEELSI